MIEENWNCQLLEMDPMIAKLVQITPRYNHDLQGMGAAGMKMNSYEMDHSPIPYVKRTSMSWGL